MGDRSMHMDHITLGVCYYPEHWPEAMWEDDVKRMKECGIEVIRIAEFAWNKFEPEEGVYTFAFFDKFVDLAERYGMKLIFCTPTATPPLWMTEKYPEVLNADIDGHTYYHGTRRHNNLTSPIYLDFSAKITEQLAKHYCNRSCIIGWQLDNEINCENDAYHSEADHVAFRKYCQEKFGTLEKFNEDMGTVFWNQTYTDWSQVHLTRRTNTFGETNPHIQLEELRFTSAAAIQFFKVQADIIRSFVNYYGAKQFITTNGIFRHIDYHNLIGDVLDFITYDNYPAFAYETWVDPNRGNGLKDRNTSFNLTKIRSISPNFGIMEQQSGAGGWNCRMKMPMPKPGQMRLWSLQAIAHGADFVSYFRWRTARFGTEIYWHGLHDYDNRENRRVRELKQIRDDVKKLTGLAGASYEAKVAVLMDYDNEWDGEHDIWHAPSDQISKDGWFVALQENHIPFDFKYVDENTEVEEFSQYKYVIYPHATILSEHRAKVLEAFVKNGGTVIFGCRTGYKDMRGQCYEMPMPGYAGLLCGCMVEEYTTRCPAYDEPVVVCAGEASGNAPEFHDVLEVTDGECMGTFHSLGAALHYEGKPAIVRKSYGEGSAWYVGTTFPKDTAKMMMDLVGISSLNPVASDMELPASMEVAVRKKKDEDWIFLLNYDKEEKEFKLNAPYVNVLTDEVMEGECKISGYDCLILKK